MMEIKEKKLKFHDVEKVEKSGWSGKYSKESAFSGPEKHYDKNFGEVDFEDHQLKEKETRDNKLNKEIEKAEKF